MKRPPLPLNAWLRFDAADRALRRLPIRSVLEIGAGEGGIGVRLAERYDYVAVEPDPQAYERARERLAELGRGEIVLGDVSALNGHREFDAVCAFEVLEHVEDDLAMLREWRERVRPGGWIVLSVPAHQRRFGAHDRLVGHYRRYDPDAMADLLRRAGFVEPQVYTCGFPLGYALEVARNTIGRLAAAEGEMEAKTAKSGRWLQPPQWIGGLTQAFTAPFRLVQRPFARTGLGTALVAVARRPQDTR